MEEVGRIVIWTFVLILLLVVDHTSAALSRSLDLMVFLIDCNHYRFSSIVFCWSSMRVWSHNSFWLFIIRSSLHVEPNCLVMSWSISLFRFLSFLFNDRLLFIWSRCCCCTFCHNGVHRPRTKFVHPTFCWALIGFSQSECGWNDWEFYTWNPAISPCADIILIITFSIGGYVFCFLQVSPTFSPLIRKICPLLFDDCMVVCKRTFWFYCYK